MVCIKWDCCDGWHNGLHFCPRDVGSENSLITLIKLAPGKDSLNFSIKGELRWIGAFGEMTYLLVEQTGKITVAFAQ